MSAAFSAFILKRLGREPGSGRQTRMPSRLVAQTLPGSAYGCLPFPGNEIRSEPWAQRSRRICMYANNVPGCITDLYGFGLEHGLPWRQQRVLDAPFRSEDCGGDERAAGQGGELGCALVSERHPDRSSSKIRTTHPLRRLTHQMRSRRGHTNSQHAGDTISLHVHATSTLTASTLSLQGLPERSAPCQSRPDILAS